MDILVATPELAPILKVGGIAEGVAGLCRALVERGHRVTVVLPRYAESETWSPPSVRRPMSIKLGASGHEGDDIRIESHACRLDSGVELVLLEMPGDHDALGVYGDDVDPRPENARRFSLFCRAVVELAAKRARAGAPFDVVHAHEWPCAMIPYLLRERRTEINRTRSVLTIHNLAHQGIFSRETLDALGLGAEHFHMDRLEFYGRVNFLKAGILAADAITTVSTTYAREILTPEFGELLDGLLRANKHKLYGIVNGIDLSVWDPSRDSALPVRYDVDDPRDKALAKRALLRELRLDLSLDRPLVVSLGRLVEQKGTDILARAIPAMVAAGQVGANVAIAGKGEPAIERALGEACASHEGRAVFLGEVSDPLAHRLIAGADFVVMPSRFEPCGIVQLHAQRYGALPIARRTGGLADTIVDMSSDLETGTGFLFDDASRGALVHAIERALLAMGSPRFPELVRRVMRLELGWQKPAHRYEQLYRSLF